MITKFTEFILEKKNMKFKITKFQLFESYKEPNNWYAENEPKLHDYVILDINWHPNLPKLDFFFNNNIGQISKLKKDNKNRDYIQYQIIYENSPKEFKKYILNNRFSYVYRSQIKYFSSNKEDLEAILTANKYNL
jgi:hypothetical protein